MAYPQDTEYLMLQLQRPLYDAEYLLNPNLDPSYYTCDYIPLNELVLPSPYAYISHLYNMEDSNAHYSRTTGTLISENLILSCTHGLTRKNNRNTQFDASQLRKGTGQVFRLHAEDCNDFLDEATKHPIAMGACARNFLEFIEWIDSYPDQGEYIVNDVEKLTETEGGQEALGLLLEETHKAPEVFYDWCDSHWLEMIPLEDSRNLSSMLLGKDTHFESQLKPNDVVFFDQGDKRFYFLIEKVYKDYLILRIEEKHLPKIEGPVDFWYRKNQELTGDFSCMVSFTQFFTLFENYEKAYLNIPHTYVDKNGLIKKDFLTTTVVGPPDEVDYPQWMPCDITLFITIGKYDEKYGFGDYPLPTFNWNAMWQTMTIVGYPQGTYEPCAIGGEALLDANDINPDIFGIVTLSNDKCVIHSQGMSGSSFFSQILPRTILGVYSGFTPIEDEDEENCNGAYLRGGYNYLRMVADFISSFIKIRCAANLVQIHPWWPSPLDPYNRLTIISTVTTILNLWELRMKTKFGISPLALYTRAIYVSEIYLHPPGSTNIPYGWGFGSSIKLNIPANARYMIIEYKRFNGGYFVHNKVENASGEEVDMLFNADKEVDADLKLLSEYLSKKVNAYNPAVGIDNVTFNEQVSNLQKTFAFRFSEKTVPGKDPKTDPFAYILPPPLPDRGFHFYELTPLPGEPEDPDNPNPPGIPPLPIVEPIPNPGDPEPFPFWDYIHIFWPWIIGGGIVLPVMACGLLAHPPKRMKKDNDDSDIEICIWKDIDCV